MSRVRVLVALGLCVTLVAGHGSLLYPLPRGGVDRDVEPFASGGWPKGHYTCTCTNGTESDGKKCLPGQSCLWFNQGCTIGCPCSGNGTMSRHPNYSACGTPAISTNNAVRTRTINRGATPGSKEDVYRYMPWRAPGSAVPADPCGVAGGDQHGVHQTAGGEYFPTKHAKIGDHGSKLQPYFSGANWKAGSVVEASWFIQANHAGGYYYRLCPADEELSEACFERTPVPWGSNETIIRLGDGNESVVNATFLTEGTLPKGSSWKMNPVPGCCPGASDTSAGTCEKAGVTCGSYEHTAMGHKCGDHQCGHDSGLGVSKPAFAWPTDDKSAPPTGVAPKFAIVDKLQLPPNLKKGHWVLGWRWDCEETAQVWMACSDINIV